MEMTNREFAEGPLKDICVRLAGDEEDEDSAYAIEKCWATQRQASKYRMGKGRVLAMTRSKKAT